jgi:ADP-ribosyl-[dinitrogen reductase] hydrolase
MKDVLIKGGDTDTNAAIVGGLLGAQGINKIPIEWITKVMDFKCDEDFTHAEVGRTRPEFLCPRYHLMSLIKAIC